MARVVACTFFCFVLTISAASAGASSSERGFFSGWWFAGANAAANDAAEPATGASAGDAAFRAGAESLRKRIPYTASGDGGELSDNAFALEPVFQSAYADGAAAVAKLHDTDCAKRSALAFGCRSTSDDERRRFAVAQANCFLKKCGLATVPCDDSEPVMHCTQRMARANGSGDESGQSTAEVTHGPSSVAFDTFTSFYNRYHDMCFFLQRESYIDEQKRAVHSLYTATAHTAEHLKRFHSEARELSHSLFAAMESGTERVTQHITRNEEREIERHQRVLHATDAIQTEQTQTLSMLHNHSVSLSGLMRDGMELQTALHASTSKALGSLKRAQSELQTQQISLLETANDTHLALNELSTDQKNRFRAAQQSLTELHTQQQSLTASIDRSFAALSRETERIQRQQIALHQSMHDAESALSALATHQRSSFEAARHQLTALHSQSEELQRNLSGSLHVIEAGQLQIKAGQSLLLSTVTATHSELRVLSAEQHRSFAAAATQLSSLQSAHSALTESVNAGLASIERQHTRLINQSESVLTSVAATNAEVSNLQRTNLALGSELRHTLESVLHGIERIISLDLSVLTQIVHVWTLLWYAAAFATIIGITGGVKRVSAVRWILLTALAIEAWIETQLHNSYARAHAHAAGTAFGIDRSERTYVYTCRVLFAVTACGLTIWRAITYRSPTERLLSALHELQSQWTARSGDESELHALERRLTARIDDCQRALLAAQNAERTERERERERQSAAECLRHELPAVTDGRTEGESDRDRDGAGSDAALYDREPVSPDLLRGVKRLDEYWPRQTKRRRDVRSIVDQNTITLLDPIADGSSAAGGGTGGWIDPDLLSPQIEGRKR